MSSPMNTNNPANTTTGTPGGSGILSNFVSENAIPLLGGILGGVFGMSGSPQQSVGYQGGIPDYTAQRSLLPDAFAQTTTDPDTGETVARRPGSMGRRYFTDVQYVPSSAGAVMQGTGLPAVVDQPEADTETLSAGNLAGLFSLLSSLGINATPTISTFTPGAVDDSTTTTTTPGESTFTLGDIVTSDTTTVADTPVNRYLQTLGFNATTPTTLTPAMIQSAQEAGFSLDDLAGALNTSTENLNAVLNPSAIDTTTIGPTSTFTLGETDTDIVNTVINNELNKFFVDERNFVAGQQQNVTAADLQAALDEGFSKQQLATAFNTDVANIDAVLNQTTTTTTGTASSSTFTPAGTSQTAIANPINKYLIDNRGFTIGTEATVTQDDLKALRDQGGFTVEQIAAGLGTTKEAVQAILDYDYAAGGQVLDAVELAMGGMAMGGPNYLAGATDGMADLVPATIGGTQPAALSDGEFVIPADVVSHLGNGNSDAGAKQLYSMMDRVRKERTGTTKQGPEINPTKMMPA